MKWTRDPSSSPVLVAKATGNGFEVVCSVVQTPSGKQHVSATVSYRGVVAEDEETAKHLAEHLARVMMEAVRKERES